MVTFAFVASPVVQYKLFPPIWFLNWDSALYALCALGGVPDMQATMRYGSVRLVATPAAQYMVCKVCSRLQDAWHGPAAALSFAAMQPPKVVRDDQGKTTGRGRGGGGTLAAVVWYG